MEEQEVKKQDSNMFGKILNIFLILLIGAFYIWVEVVDPVRKDYASLFGKICLFGAIAYGLDLAIKEIGKIELFDFLNNRGGITNKFPPQARTIMFVIFTIFSVVFLLYISGNSMSIFGLPLQLITTTQFDVLGSPVASVITSGLVAFPEEPLLHDILPWGIATLFIILINKITGWDKNSFKLKFIKAITYLVLCVAVWVLYHSFVYGAHDLEGTKSVAVFGLIGGIILLATGNIMYTIVYHFLNNVIVAVKYLPAELRHVTLIDVGIILVIFIICYGILTYYKAKVRRKKK